MSRPTLNSYYHARPRWSSKRKEKEIYSEEIFVSLLELRPVLYRFITTMACSSEQSRMAVIKGQWSLYSCLANEISEASLTVGAGWWRNVSSFLDRPLFHFSLTCQSSGSQRKEVQLVSVPFPCSDQQADEFIARLGKWSWPPLECITY